MLSDILIGMDIVVYSPREVLPRGADPGGEAACVAFLEELFTARPDVFNLGAEWFVRQWAYTYVNAGRESPCALRARFSAGHSAVPNRRNPQWPTLP